LNKSSEPNTTQPLIEVFSQLGHPWAVPLILVLGERDSDLEYHEIQDRMVSATSRKIADTALSKCLSDLVEAGLVHRTVHTDSALNGEYTLTLAGYETYQHVIRMQRWTQNGFNNRRPMADCSSAC